MASCPSSLVAGTSRHSLHSASLGEALETHHSDLAGPPSLQTCSEGNRTQVPWGGGQQPPRSERLPQAHCQCQPSPDLVCHLLKRDDDKLQLSASSLKSPRDALLRAGYSTVWGRGRAAPDCGTQPRHPTPQAGPSACLPPSPQPTLDLPQPSCLEAPDSPHPHGTKLGSRAGQKPIPGGSSRGWEKAEGPGMGGGIF